MKNGSVQKKIICLDSKVLHAQIEEYFDDFFLEKTQKKVSYGQLARDDRGKPFPVFGWSFSVAHSENYLAIVLSLGREIATDLEIRAHGSKLTERIRKRILMLGEEPVNGDYLNNYVIKETYGKLTGEGIGAGFRNIDANDLIKKFQAIDCSDEKYAWWILQGSNL